MKSKCMIWFLMLFALFPALVYSLEKSKKSELDLKVNQLLSKMSLEEKIGQMTQISIEVVAQKNEGTLIDPLKLDKQKLREAILDYHVGSILNVGTHAHSVEKWHAINTAIQDVATKKSRLKIPILYGIDAIHGAGYIKDATLFPQNIGMAATWNPELIKKNGEITAYEMRAAGIPWNFNPVLGIGRHPAWPRLWETFGEDPYLVSVMGKEYVKGLEGDSNNIQDREKVASCVKHYLGYSFPVTGKDRTPAWIPERMLREYFIPPFKAAIDAGAHTVMVNSSEINGIPVHSSHFYLTQLLRNELGFDGFIVSDWNDIRNLHEREKVAATHKEAVKIAVMAGIDMSMVPMDYSFFDLLLELVREGEVPESRIDDAVVRILKLKYKSGLFHNPYPVKELKQKFASEEFRQVNLQAARESVTLLKNKDSILPLLKNRKVLVTGPSADKLSYMNGGWTITWQGDREELYPGEKLTILEAIQNKIGKKNVKYVSGVKINEEIDIQAAVNAGREADVIIACIGEAPYCETPGNINDLTLPEVQLDLVDQLSDIGVPIVLVLVEGRPRIINRIVDDVSAIIMGYLPGMEGGLAISDVLFGDVNPSGKLPITYPRHPNDLTLYDHKYSENVGAPNVYNPQFPFGYGLSYTTFEYKNLQLDKNSYTIEDSIHVSVVVSNTGEITCKEVVQLYLCDMYASVTPSVKRLKRFKKVAIHPGENKMVSFTLYKDDLAFIGRNNKPVVEPGKFEVIIANLKKGFILE